VIGFQLADAVLGSGSILRNEPDTRWIPHFDDMLSYRVNILGKPKYPKNAILTSSGDIDLRHPIFCDVELEVIIFTTSKGEKFFLQKNASLLPLKSQIHLEILDSYVVSPIAGNEESNKVPLLKAISLLKTKYNVSFLDITAGGRTISSLVHQKLVDEFRVTISGMLVGPFNSMRVQRPELFNLPEDVYFDSDSAPLINYAGLRLQGDHHLFLRGRLHYRHKLSSEEMQQEQEVEQQQQSSALSQATNETLVSQNQSRNPL